MTHPIKEILLEELEQVTDALHLNLTDNRMTPGQKLAELDHWTERLRRVNRALQSLSGIVPLTQQERNTLLLLLLIEFHDGNFSEDEDAPFDVQAAESARAKLKG